MLETDGFQFELLNLITYVSYTFEAINFRYLDSTAVSGPEDTLFRALPITRYILDLPPHLVTVTDVLGSKLPLFS